MKIISLCSANSPFTTLPERESERERVRKSERAQLAFIYDFRVDEAFENMINISSSLQALQVIFVSPTKAFDTNEKGDGRLCSLLLISECERK